MQFREQSNFGLACVDAVRPKPRELGFVPHCFAFSNSLESRLTSVFIDACQKRNSKSGAILVATIFTESYQKKANKRYRVVNFSWLIDTAANTDAKAAKRT